MIVWAVAVNSEVSSGRDGVIFGDFSRDGVWVRVNGWLALDDAVPISQTQCQGIFFPSLFFWEGGGGYVIVSILMIDVDFCMYVGGTLR